MKANESSYQQPVQLPAAFVRWWLSEPASEQAREPQQPHSLPKSSPSARRWLNEHQLPESSRKIASVP